ncbi:MAG: hypothetical protein KAR45_19740, partial [Desulfobacteraceae bacterium]|nr:hypothetical protein [Desulfobacteraceae bacterium]
LLPSFAAMSFVVYPILVLFDPDIMLGDPGIGWHLISGHYMIDHKELLNHDIFSFTRPGQEWTTYEWLFQCFAAGLEKIGGLPLVTAVSALIYGSLPIITYKRMLKEGTNIYIAVLLLFLTFFGLFAHCHARPHIFTYFFFAILLERIFSYEQQKISARSLFLFVPVMILWVNFHGGFLVGLAIPGIAFLVYWGRFFYSKEHADKDRAKIYFFLGFALFMASLINPFGWNLHLSILHYLNLNSLHMMAEYTSPNFNSPYSGEKVFEILILSLFLLISRKKHKIGLLELTLLIFFIYQSFHAVRHIFLFCLLAVPILAKELTRIINKHDNRFTRRSRKIVFEQQTLKSDRLWIPLICITLIVLSLTATDLFKKDLYGRHLTSGAGSYIKNNIEKLSNPFNTENIGGALIYHFWPEIKVFGDDRSDFYGDDFYIDDYMETLLIKPKWENALKKYNVTSAIVSNQQLTTLMKASPNWQIAYQDKKSTIFLINKTGRKK